MGLVRSTLAAQGRSNLGSQAGGVAAAGAGCGQVHVRCGQECLYCSADALLWAAAAKQQKELAGFQFGAAWVAAMQ
jgi:hypothetical protein